MRGRNRIAPARQTQHWDEPGSAPQPQHPVSFVAPEPASFAPGPFGLDGPRPFAALATGRPGARPRARVWRWVAVLTVLGLVGGAGALGVRRPDLAARGRALGFSAAHKAEGAVHRLLERAGVVRAKPDVVAPPAPLVAPAPAVAPPPPPVPPAEAVAPSPPAPPAVAPEAPVPAPPAEADSSRTSEANTARPRAQRTRAHAKAGRRRALARASARAAKQKKAPAVAAPAKPKPATLEDLMDASLSKRAR